MTHLVFFARVVIVFLATMCASLLWVVYMRASNATPPKVLRAVLADCGLVSMGMLNIVGYTSDHRLGVPILCATALGTTLALRRKV